MLIGLGVHSKTSPDLVGPGIEKKKRREKNENITKRNNVTKTEVIRLERLSKTFGSEA